MRIVWENFLPTLMFACYQDWVTQKAPIINPKLLTYYYILIRESSNYCSRNICYVNAEEFDPKIFRASFGDGRR